MFQCNGTWEVKAYTKFNLVLGLNVNNIKSKSVFIYNHQSQDTELQTMLQIIFLELNLLR